MCLFSTHVFPTTLNFPREQILVVLVFLDAVILVIPSEILSAWLFWQKSALVGSVESKTCKDAGEQINVLYE